MIVLLCLPIVVLAALGFLASALVNVSFWIGSPIYPDYHDLMFKGIFIVHVPTMIVILTMSPQLRQSRSWNSLLRGAPPWVAPAFYGVFAYGVVNFVLGMAGLFDTSGENVFRVGSSHAMVFYFAGFAINLAALGRRHEPPPAPCERGHEMASDADFCPRCGAARRGAVRPRDA